VERRLRDVETTDLPGDVSPLVALPSTNAESEASLPDGVGLPSFVHELA
jgi:hypothetical protein